MSYEDTLKSTACDYAEYKLKQEGKKYSESVAKELVKFSDVTLEKGYKVSYEFTETVLPQKYSEPIEAQLRQSIDLLKDKNKVTIEEETVALVNSSITAIMSVAKDEKSFEEASREIIHQGKTAVKKVMIENVRDVAISQGKTILQQNGIKIFQSGAKSNPAVNAVVLGYMLKDSVFKLLDGKISEEQFIKEVAKKGTLMALETMGAFVGQFALPIPVVGATIGSMVTSIACNCIISVMDASYEKIKGLYQASKNQVAADRRKVISKIKADALAEMSRQRKIMQKYFNDEKLCWNKNIKVGFELIADGTFSNDVEVIAQGLDKILQNFNSKVAFSDRGEFIKDFKQRKIILNL